MALGYAELSGKDVKSYREFGIARSTSYEWRKAFRVNGSPGPIPRKLVARHHPPALSQEATERILELRKTYGLRSQRVASYLERYHSIRISCASVYRTLVRHGLGWIRQG
jgi:transposase